MILFHSQFDLILTGFAPPQNKVISHYLVIIIISNSLHTQEIPLQVGVFSHRSWQMPIFTSKKCACQISRWLSKWYIRENLLTKYHSWAYLFQQKIVPKTTYGVHTPTYSVVETWTVMQKKLGRDQLVSPDKTGHPNLWRTMAHANFFNRLGGWFDFARISDTFFCSEWIESSACEPTRQSLCDTVRWKNVKTTLYINYTWATRRHAASTLKETLFVVQRKWRILCRSAAVNAHWTASGQGLNSARNETVPLAAIC